MELTTVRVTPENFVKVGLMAIAAIALYRLVIGKLGIADPAGLA